MLRLRRNIDFYTSIVQFLFSLDSLFGFPPRPQRKGKAVFFPLSSLCWLYLALSSCFPSILKWLRHVKEHAMVVVVVVVVIVARHSAPLLEAVTTILWHP